MGAHAFPPFQLMINLTRKVWYPHAVSATLAHTPPTYPASFVLTAVKSDFLRVGVKVMADAKIEIKVGSFVFSGEGTEKWLSGELEKLLVKIPELVDVAPANRDSDDAGTGGGGTKNKGKVGTLSAFLKEKNATSNQVKKFLATAAWLHDSTGRDRLATKEVKNALKKANQGKLTNPANSLNQNVGKGHCEKDGGSFFVTEPGRTSLGA
jgi:hypothetical protein